MGQVKKHPPVKLIMGFIFKDQNLLNNAKNILEKQFGKIDFESETVPFRHTDYYEKEFAKDLNRKFISFKRLIRPQELPKIKIVTNSIEQRISSGLNRKINIDPGYIDLSKLVLASTKDYKHRIYLNKGIYAEITLFYQNKSFRCWDWTYPDYKTKEHITIFNNIRDDYAKEIKNR
jgi:hypothetical protein